MALKTEGDKLEPIYVGDKVIGNSRWIGDDDNPYEGKTGTVVRIGYGPPLSMRCLQSMCDLNYLSVDVNYEGETDVVFLYTLNLTERNQRNSELLDKGELIYIGDIVEVIKPEHTLFGKSGWVRAIYDSEGSLNYEVRDADILKLSTDLSLKMVDMINTQFQKRMSDETEFEGFKINVKKEKPELYELLEKDNDLKGTYKMLIRGDVIKLLETDEEYNKIKQKRDKLDEENIFSIDHLSVRLMNTS